MKKSDLLIEALEAASYITDLTKEQIMSKTRKTNYVDARYIVIYILSQKGLYPDEIAEIMNFTSVNIRLMLSRINSRISGNANFRNKIKQTENYLENK